MESTRDESQDSLLRENMLVSQPSVESETNIEMIEQEINEDTEITITAIIEEINRSISSKNSSIHEDIQTELKTNSIKTTVLIEEENKETDIHKQRMSAIAQVPVMSHKTRCLGKKPTTKLYLGSRHYQATYLRLTFNP